MAHERHDPTVMLVTALGDREPTLYDILGVRVDARVEVIQRAWRLAISEHHPDRVSHLGEAQAREASEVSAEINYAAWVLADPARRRVYDLQIGIRPAPCGRCGKSGRLRLGPDQSARGYCDDCYASYGPSRARPHTS